MPSNEDTIAAIATPVGQAGIGIIRMSGSLSAPIAEKIFKPKRPLDKLRSHRLYLGHICDPATQGLIDEVLLTVMGSPHSYTREDVVEIHSHSGYLLLSRILQILLEQGARLARPGEFTFRAFANGRIDLTQAEAVVDLINAKSDKGLHLAAQQVRGALSAAVNNPREKIRDILARAEVALDFPDEEAAIISRSEAAREIELAALEPLRALIERHANRRIWLDGIDTAIVGRVNAGKSSLLNRLLNEQRAIVTPIPGTTRDTIESSLNIRGLPLNLIDTAGLRKVENEVEQIGVSLAEKKFDEADFLLVVVDQSRPLNQDDFTLLAKARGRNALLAVNKIDLPGRIPANEDDQAFSGFPQVRISALTGEGLDDLKEAIIGCVLQSEIDTTTSHTAPNLRHRRALEETVESLERAVAGAKDELPVEIVALELRNALDALGEIIGETSTDEVLDSIFSQFCLGK